MTSPEDAKKMIDEVVNKAKGLADSQLKGLPKLVDSFMLSERQIIKKIISKQKQIRAKLSKSVVLRKIPELRFHKDMSSEHAARIDEILKSI